MALGEILKNAREQKGLTPSVVAESTHMKVQVVEDLEREDFRRIAAPIYGRGFVKLYAEFLQLDPEPLIRDFMELYAGAKIPAVRMKRVDAPAEPQPERLPVTRTVTGPAAASVQPQKQTVQPKPAVRPLNTPVAVAQEAAKPVVSEELKQPESKAQEKPVATKPVPVAEEPADQGLPPLGKEDAFDESDEPDLFRPPTQRRRQTVTEDFPSEDDRKPLGEPTSSGKPKLPIFKIGGRLDEKREPEIQDDAAHARRRARIDSFINGFKNLRDGVERKLPVNLPRQQVIALCGVGAAFVVFLTVGIGVLFKMTGSNVKEAPGTVISVVAPLPDLYVD